MTSQLQERAKLKLVGEREVLEGVLKNLDLHYITVRTSPFLEHDEDDEVHIFVTILGERYG